MKILDKKQTEDLVLALKNGDTTAFDRLFSVYGIRLYHFALGYLKSKEDAEEVMQEVFLKIWRNRKTLKPDTSFKSYVFTIAWHHILELFERAGKRQEYKHHILEETIAFSDDLDERINFRLLLERVELLISQLPQRQREVLIKKKKEGLSIKEIADDLGITQKTVDNHLTEAMKNIRKGMGNDQITSLLLFLFSHRRKNHKISD